MGAVKQAILRVQEAYDISQDEALQILDDYIEGKEGPEVIVSLMKGARK